MIQEELDGATDAKLRNSKTNTEGRRNPTRTCTGVGRNSISGKQPSGQEGGARTFSEEDPKTINIAMKGLTRKQLQVMRSWTEQGDTKLRRIKDQHQGPSKLDSNTIQELMEMVHRGWPEDAGRQEPPQKQESTLRRYDILTSRESQRNNKQPRKNAGEENRRGRTRTETERLTVAKKLSREKPPTRSSCGAGRRSRNRARRTSLGLEITKDERPGEARNTTLAVRGQRKPLQKGTPLLRSTEQDEDDRKGNPKDQESASWSRTKLQCH
ncbi:hypothetical protein BC827DRAFT_1156361 [Russula dissimulans]|nr:hypothetical protein BC827DRAFT_1156361 [Russula dissimulans]